MEVNTVHRKTRSKLNLCHNLIIIRTNPDRTMIGTDNSRMEAFHSILKREEVYLKAYQTLTEVQAAIGWYINFYNRNRISNVA
ncbi:hypothetical protein FKX73_15380 [Listeria monocytogenes]|nr:hypothetical protein [Listeria monocytogenes]EBH4320366.1 hypothetical protein [Listeria monocytogenes]